MRRHWACLIVVSCCALVLTQCATDEGTEWERLERETVALQRQGHYDRAIVVAKKAVGIAEEELGPDHPDVAAALTNLAYVHRVQAQYAAAEPLYKRALAIQEKALGPDDPLVAKSLANLATLYHAQSQYATAEPLYKRSLAIREKTVGPEHPYVGAVLQEMSRMYL